jgi:hypothetical protein
MERFYLIREKPGRSFVASSAEAAAGAIGADPVMKLGAPIVIAVQTDDTEDESGLAGDKVQTEGVSCRHRFEP